MNLERIIKAMKQMDNRWPKRFQRWENHEPPKAAGETGPESWAGLVQD